MLTINGVFLKNRTQSKWECSVLIIPFACLGMEKTRIILLLIHSINSVYWTQVPLWFFLPPFPVPAPIRSFGGITSSPFLLSLLGSVGVISVSGTWLTINLLVSPILLAMRISSRMAEIQKQPRWDSILHFYWKYWKRKRPFPTGLARLKEIWVWGYQQPFFYLSFSWQLRSLELVNLGPYANPKGS